MKLEAPRPPEPKVDPRSTSDPDEQSVQPPNRPADRPLPNPDNPPFRTTSRTPAKVERTRPRPLQDDDDDFDPIDPVTGSRKRPVWLVPAFVIVDLVIILIVIGQLSMFVGGDDLGAEEPVRIAPTAHPSDRTNFEPGQLPDPVPSSEDQSQALSKKFAADPESTP
jgi:hypothetical protein